MQFMIRSREAKSKRAVLTLYIFCAFCLAYFARESLFAMEAKSEAKTEAKSEGQAPSPQARNLKEFNDKTTQVNTLASRIQSNKEQIKDLIQQKNASKIDEEKAILIEQIKSLHVEVLQDTRDYNEVREELILRFPAEGKDTGKRYLPMRELSVSEIESEIGLDAQLTGIKRKIEKTYEAFAPAHEVKVRKPASRTDSPSEDEPDRPQKFKIEM